MADRQRPCALCANRRATMHTLPKDPELRTKWLQFLFGTDVPKQYNSNLTVCSSHFEESQCINFGQFSKGFANRLLLKPGAVPSLRTRTSAQPSTSSGTSLIDASTQTDPPRLSSRGTQLSLSSLRPHFLSRGTQTSGCSASVSISTTTADAPWRRRTSASPRPAKRPRLEDDDEEDDICHSTIIPDLTRDPAQSTTESSQIFDTSGYKDSKFLVFEKCLLELFETCPVCKGVTDARPRRRGTFLAVDQICPECQFFRQWKSQPVVGSCPTGNLQLSAAIYFTGTSFYQLEKVFKALNVRSIGDTTFRRHARSFLEPAVVHKWHAFQESECERLSRSPARIGGDMWADDAKHGIYSLMNLENNNVLDIQLVQSDEVGGRHNLEQEGLKRSLELLRSKNVAIDHIVTDGHPQIQTFLRERGARHEYAVRLREKGPSKKRHKVAEESEAAALKKWQRGIRSHVSCCETSSSTETERIHPDHRSTDPKKHFQPGSKVAKRTSTLESFHGAVKHFSPKNVVPYIGMLCRLYLAAMHFNENAGHAQARTTSARPGDEKGGDAVKAVRKNTTFCYIFSLMALLFDEVLPDPQPYLEELQEVLVPETRTHGNSLRMNWTTRDGTTTQSIRHK